MLFLRKLWQRLKGLRTSRTEDDFAPPTDEPSAVTSQPRVHPRVVALTQRQSKVRHNTHTAFTIHTTPQLLVIFVWTAVFIGTGLTITLLVLKVKGVRKRRTHHCTSPGNTQTSDIYFAKNDGLLLAYARCCTIAPSHRILRTATPSSAASCCPR